MGGALPSAHENDDTAGKRTHGRLECADLVTFGESPGRGRRYEPLGSASLRFGLILTTSQVTPAASAITLTMNTTSPIRPRTVAMTDLE